MDGYSVKDAALVLGIPERRVWELIARGVLASAREGPDGMRVFLQPRTSSVDPAAAEPRIYRADEPDAPRQNGNGDGGSHEMSPFRELLTEFRSLTERYGQALLALGEARGEVASLRSRVELLEARMDLRLPNTRPASTVAWEIPAYPPEAPPAAEEPAEPESAAVPDDTAQPMAASEEALIEAADAESLELEAPEAPEAEAAPTAEPILEGPEAPSKSRKRRADTRRRKIKGGRTALAGIAEALARAEDPTSAELPGADEAVEALAALQRDIETHPAEPEDEIEAGAAPEEAALASAPEVEGVVEEQPDEPELYATVSMSAVSVPAVELVAEEEVETVAEEPADVMDVSFEALDEVEEPEPMVEATVALQEPEPEPEPTPEASAAPEEAAEPVDVEMQSTDVAPLPEVQPELEVQAQPEIVPEPPHELVAAPDSPYSTDVVEPDWFADGDFTWLEAAQAEAAQQAPAPSAEEEPEPPPEIADEPEPETAVADEPMSPPEPLSPPEAMPPPEPMSPPEPMPEHEAQVAPGAGFEPSAGDELRAEEEARAAIQDAFAEHDEADAPTTEIRTFETPIQEAVAPAEPAVEEPRSEAPTAEAPAPVEAAIQDAFGEQTIEEEQAAAAPQPEADAIQEAFSEPDASPIPQVEAPPSVAPAFDEPAEQPDASVEQQEAPAFESAPAPSSEPEPPVAREPDSPPQPPDEPMEAAAPATPSPVTEPAPATQAQRGEEELMWLGDEFEEASLEIASQGWRSADAAPPPAQPATLELSDAELSQLAEDEGWDAAEVEAIRSLLGRPTPPVTAEGAVDQPPTPATPPVAAEASVMAAPPPAPRPVQRHSMSSMGDPQWLKGRRGPAATAYRRLRRLFPG